MSGHSPRSSERKRSKSRSMPTGSTAVMPSAVADRAVGGGAAALDEDPLRAAEVDDVPDDQEVALELELLDEGQLALHLAPRALVIRPVAVARAQVRHRAQERGVGLARRQRVVGELVGQVVQGEAQPVGQRFRVAEEDGPVAKRAAICFGDFRWRSAFSASSRPGVGQRALLADAGEDVEQRAARGARVAHAIRRDRVETARVGEIEQGLVRGLLRPAAMALHVDDDLAGPEGFEQSRQPSRCRAACPAHPRRRERRAPRPSPGSAWPARASLALGHAALGRRDQPAEVPIADAALDEQGQRIRRRRS